MKSWQVFRHDYKPYTKLEFPDSFTAEGVLAEVKKSFPFLLLPVVSPWRPRNPRTKPWMLSLVGESDGSKR